jgi:hypothetical protein
MPAFDWRLNANTNTGIRQSVKCGNVCMDHKLVSFVNTVQRSCNQNENWNPNTSRLQFIFVLSPLVTTMKNRRPTFINYELFYPALPKLNYFSNSVYKVFIIRRGINHSVRAELDRDDSLLQAHSQRHKLTPPHIWKFW